MTRPPLVYTIAGSEATGGAGFQADLKTFQQLGCYGLGALTCIVSFDPKNNWEHRFVPIAAPVIAEQLEAAMAAHDLTVAKIGMLGTVPTIETVAATLQTQEWREIVLDPVLICKGQEPGAALDIDNALQTHMLPLATVVTPNLFETKILSGITKITTTADLIAAAKIIADKHQVAVLAKGGTELPGEQAIDILFDGTEVTTLALPKIGNERVSGAGCTLAAALAAELAKGSNLVEAANIAKALVNRGIQNRLSANTPFTSVWQGA